MARTSTPNRNQGIEDWFLAHHDSRRQGQLPIRPPEVQNFINFLWPVAMDYYSPLNPVLLTECLATEQMNRAPVWMVRDGLVPLLWFFRTNPAPTGFKGTMLIHEDFAPFVPSAWRNSVGTYRMESIRGSGTRRKKLLLMGVVMDTYCSISHLEKQLHLLVETLGKQEIAKREIQAFFLGKFDGFGNEHRHEFFAEYAFKVSSSLGTNLRALNWRNIDSIESYEDYDVVEFNERLLFVDSFMLHHPMGRGAKLIDLGGNSPTNGSGDGELVRLSPFHGIRVKRRITGTPAWDEHQKNLSKGFQAFAKFEAAMRSETNKRFPWPSWFTQWSRANVKQK